MGKNERVPVGSAGTADDASLIRPTGCLSCGVSPCCACRSRCPKETLTGPGRAEMPPLAIRASASARAACNAARHPAYGSGGAARCVRQNIPGADSNLPGAGAVVILVTYWLPPANAGSGRMKRQRPGRLRFSPLHTAMPDIEIAKCEARARALAARAGCDPALGAGLARHVIDEIKLPPGAAVSGFWAMPGRSIVCPAGRCTRAATRSAAAHAETRQTVDLPALAPGAEMVRERFGTFRPWARSASPRSVRAAAGVRPARLPARLRRRLLRPDAAAAAACDRDRLRVRGTGT